MRLTKWHKGTEKPVRDGVYERDYRGGRKQTYCMFRDGDWYCGYDDISYAATDSSPSLNQTIAWRGITKDGK